MAEITLCERGECLTPIDYSLVAVNIQAKESSVVDMESDRIAACKLFRLGLLIKNPNFSADECPFAAIRAAVESVKADRSGEFDAS